MKTKKCKGVTELDKKTITSIVCTMALSLIMVSAHAQEKEIIKMEYEISNRTLTVNAELQEGKKNFVNVAILPDAVELSEEIIKNNDDVILKTVQTDTTGKITSKIIMPVEWQGKRFMCYINADEEQLRQCFSTVTVPNLEEITKKINSADKNGIVNIINSDIVQSGLGRENERKAESIAMYIYSQRPTEGYDNDSFLDTYMVGEGVAYLGDGEISLLELIEEYAGYLEKDYLGEYIKLTDAEKQSLETMFAINKADSGFDDTFDKNLFLAKYRNTESSVELGNLVTTYFTQNNISMSEFNQITNNVYKEDVFAQLYVSRRNASSVEKIIADFDGLTKSALEKNGAISTGGGGGGIGGSQGPSVTVAVGTGNVGSAMFNDISSHWAKNQIESACQKGIVSGFENGSFKPDKKVTRAEFITMMAKALNLNIEQGNESTFADVVPDEWYTGCVVAGVNAGLIFGDENNHFNPHMEITRQDVAVIIARALEYKGAMLGVGDYGFADEADFSGYALDAINSLATAGVVSGYENKTFLPKKTASRAEAVVMILKMEELINEKNN